MPVPDALFELFLDRQVRCPHKAERLGDGLGDQAGVVERSERDEERAIGEIRQSYARRLDAQPRLADARRTDQADKADFWVR